jgi:hypothetical protein|nr:MAG TPA: hypothetical protein [Caudoviricetes sp.]
MLEQMKEDWGKELKNASNKEQLRIIKDCLTSIRDDLKISNEDTISLLLYIDPYNINPPMGIDEEVVSEVYRTMLKFNYFIKFYVFNNDVYYHLDGRKVSLSYLRNYLSEDDSFGWLKFVTRRNCTNQHLYLCCVKKNIAKIKAAMVDTFTKLLNLN